MENSDAIDEGQAMGRSPAFLAPLLVWVAVAAFGYLALTFYEGFVLGLPFFPYEPARFTDYYLARTGFALAVSVLIVKVIVGYRASASTLDNTDLRPMESLAALIFMAGALGLVSVFLLHPAKFEELAAEDGALEWASAIFALFASALFAADFLRRLRSRGDWRSVIGITIAGSLAALLFLLGMEEISWMQRVVGFDTPAAMVEANWQDEFNLHNFQTYLAETIYYSGAVILLIFLPLIKEAAPGWPLLLAVSDFIPGRFVVAASAPISMFNYGHWNLIPIQITVMITVFVLVAYAIAAAGRRNRPECLLFLFLASSVAAGQALFLINGSSLNYVPNTTEFKEFFIAFGLACFAVGAYRRSPRQEPGHRRITGDWSMHPNDNSSPDRRN